MFYIDASATVAAVTEEVQSERMWAWLDRQPAGQMFVSDWTHTEVASALSIKLRTGQLTIDERATALATWQQWQTANLHTLAVTPEHFRKAALFATQHDLSVRAGDALHLAIAAATGFTLVTFDATMAKAAPLLGIPVEQLG